MLCELNLNKAVIKKKSGSLKTATQNISHYSFNTFFPYSVRGTLLSSRDKQY